MTHPETWIARYKPLLLILAVIALASSALAAGTGASFSGAMHYFMGLFFLIFALFKLFDIEGFVKGFRKYDMLAQAFPRYAYAYPFIELLLGIGWLAQAWMLPLAAVTFVLMFVSAAGVLKSLAKGMDVRCACLGTTIDVPLSTVSVVENVGMGVMALYQLAWAL